MARPQFRLRTLFWITLAAAILMVPIRDIVQTYRRLQFIYTVEIPTLKKEGKPLPGEPGYKPLPGHPGR